jgi:hypothetical protein
LVDSTDEICRCGAVMVTDLFPEHAGDNVSCPDILRFRH